jgi:hypothetical protein
MRPRDEQLLAIADLPDRIAPFDEDGIRSCIEQVDDTHRTTIAEALLTSSTIKTMLQKIFQAGAKLSAALARTGQQLVAIVQNAVSQVVATVASLVDSLFAIFHGV